MYSIENAPEITIEITAQQALELGIHPAVYKGEPGPQGLQGERGESGVYIGGGDPPESANLWIDPEGNGENGLIADAVIASDTTWSSQNIIEKLCPEASAAGNPVRLDGLIGGYPLKLRAVVEPEHGGSGDPSPDNPLQVAVTESVTVQQCGKNLLPHPYRGSGGTSGGLTTTVNADGSVHLNGTATSDRYFTLYGGYAGNNYKPSWLIPGAQYTISGARGQVSARIYFYKDDGTAVFYSDRSFVVPEYNTVGIFLFVAKGVTVNETCYPQLEAGAVATDYEPYACKSYNIPLPEGFSGGEVDITGGAAHEKYAKTVLDGSIIGFTPNAANTCWNAPYYSAVGGIVGSLSAIGGYCSHFPANIFSVNMNSGGFIFTTPANMAPYFADCDALNAYLAGQCNAGTPVVVYYKLAEPVALALDAQSIIAQEGANTLIADGNSVVASGLQSPKYMLALQQGAAAEALMILEGE